MTTGLLLVDHGSRREASNELLRCVAGLVGALAGPHVRVVEAHMELAEPTIADGLATLVEAGITQVKVVPYFLGPGRHATRDIPAMVAEAAAAHPGLEVEVAPPLGVHVDLARVVLDRAGLSPVAVPWEGSPRAECSGTPETCRAPFCRRRS